MKKRLMLILISVALAAYALGPPRVKAQSAPSKAEFFIVAVENSSGKIRVTISDRVTGKQVNQMDYPHGLVWKTQWRAMGEQTYDKDARFYAIRGYVMNAVTMSSVKGGPIAPGAFLLIDDQLSDSGYRATVRRFSPEQIRKSPPDGRGENLNTENEAQNNTNNRSAKARAARASFTRWTVETFSSVIFFVNRAAYPVQCHRRQGFWTLDMPK